MGHSYGLLTLWDIPMVSLGHGFINFMGHCGLLMHGTFLLFINFLWFTNIPMGLHGTFYCLWFMVY